MGSSLLEPHGFKVKGSGGQRYLIVASMMIGEWNTDQSRKWARSLLNFVVVLRED